MKKVTTITKEKLGRIVVKGAGNTAKESEVDEMVRSICGGVGYTRSKYVKIGRHQKPMINVDGKVVEEVSLREKLVSMSLKSGARGQVCKILLDKGKISRDEFKKYNQWGDTRFIDEFVVEGYEEGQLVYVVKKELRE